MKSLRGLLLLFAWTLSPGLGTAADASTTAKVAESAQTFLATLDLTKRELVEHAFNDPAKKRWSNFPIRMYPRNGVRMGDLTPRQRAAAMKLLDAALSAEGLRKVREIMQGDEYLRGQDRNPMFGEDEYYLAWFGQPSASKPWMLQFGGHHLAINLTFKGAQATLAPSHTAAQPANFTLEGRVIRALGPENDRAFELLASFDDQQLDAAVLDYAVPDLVLGPGKDGGTIEPEGLRASLMTVKQQDLLLELAREWVGIAHEDFAKPRMAELRSHLADTWFAWSGPTSPGSAAYFRIQGPTLIIEYAPQRGVDHIHTIYRDPTNDYGAKFGNR